MTRGDPSVPSSRRLSLASFFRSFHTPSAAVRSGRSKRRKERWRTRSERREAGWVTRYFLPSYHSFPSHPALGPSPPMLGGTGPSVTKGESSEGTVTPGEGP